MACVFKYASCLESTDSYCFGVVGDAWAVYSGGSRRLFLLIDESWQPVVFIASTPTMRDDNPRQVELYEMEPLCDHGRL